MSPEDSLAELLASLFDAQLLRVFLARRYGRAVEDRLPEPPVAPAVLAMRATQELRRQGFVVDALFDALVEEFPMREEDIRRVQAAWAGVEVVVPVHHEDEDPPKPKVPPAVWVAVVAVLLLGAGLFWRFHDRAPVITDGPVDPKGEVIVPSDGNPSGTGPTVADPPHDVVDGTGREDPIGEQPPVGDGLNIDGTAVHAGNDVNVSNNDGGVDVTRSQLEAGSDVNLHGETRLDSHGNVITAGDDVNITVGR